MTVVEGRPRLLDLFCGAGGAGRGYQQAGFDVTGVDNRPQPRYGGDRFVQADALDYVADHGRDFDAVHASPPCRDWTRLRTMRGVDGTAWLLPATREALVACGRPWVIENVPGAPLRSDYRLCGCMFGLPGLRRERWFETSWAAFELRSPCVHLDRTVTVTGHPGGSSTRDGSDGFGSTAAWRAAMGINWMTAREMAQAIPPAYTELIGRALLAALAVAA